MEKRFARDIVIGKRTEGLFMPTIEDINRNFKLAQQGKPLDMPLIVLDGAIKGKAYREANKEKIAKRMKAYREANKEKINKRCRELYWQKKEKR